MASEHEKPKDDELVCLQCGAEVAPDQWECPKCGSDRHLMKQNRVASDVPSAPAAPRRTKPSVYSGLAIIIIVAISLILVNAVDKPAAEAVQHDEDIILDINLEAEAEDAVDREIVSSFTELDDDDFDSLVGEGAWHASRGEWPEAIAAFEKALARKTDETGVIEELARAYIEIDDIDNAFFHLDRWIEIEPDDPAPYALKGSIYLGLGKHEDARDSYRDALHRTGAGERLMDEYSAKLAEINEIIAENERLEEEISQYDIGDGWIHEPMPEYTSKPEPEPEPEPESEGGTTPLTQFRVDDEEEDTFVLIGEGQENNGTELLEDTENVGEAEEAEEKEEGTIEIEVSETELETEPEHVRITGARFDSTDDDFSLYLDTDGRASPKYYYDKPNNVFWITVPNAECDFTNVPIERTFTHPIVESVRTWADEGDSIRFKIVLKETVQYSSPTIMALGFSIRLWYSPDNTEASVEE